MILFVMALALPTMAQVQSVGIGLKGGVNMPEYHYSSNDLNTLGRDPELLHRIRPMGGIQVEIPVGELLYVSPELMFVSRGDLRNFHNIPTDTDLTYLAVVNYLDLRIPVGYVFPVTSFFQPYVFAGPDFGMVFPYIKTKKLDLNLAGAFTQTGTEPVEVNKSNMAPFDVAAIGGVGFRFNINFGSFGLVTKLEAAYSYGFLNTFSKKEMESQVPAANLGTGGTHYSLGKRYNRGLEATLSIVLPLDFKIERGNGDACSNWSKDVYPTRSKGHRGF